jgi:hypothetical protein
MFMKTNLKQLLVIAASSLLFVGCCNTHQATRWEYRVVHCPPNGPEYQKNLEALMNDCGKDGWIFVSQEIAILYFKRPLR